ncbi:MAG TPA: TlpA disulfide reductase family protein [Pyrinomonadaceae bacterium]|jgi:peroxiredoxin
MMKRVALILFLVCLTAPLSVRAQQQTNEPPLDVSIKLKGVDGKTYDLAEMRGSVLLVSFGASWCQPCWAELRALEELKREYKNQPVKFLWVSIEREEEISDGKLRSFARSQKLSFPVLRDPSGFTYAQFSTRRRIPLVVFFNREGKPVAPTHAGMAEPELYKRTMRERLDKLLQAQAPVETDGTK